MTRSVQNLISPADEQSTRLAPQVGAPAAAAEHGEAATGSIENWLRDEVMPTLSQIGAGEGELLPIDDAFEDAWARLQNETKGQHQPLSGCSCTHCGG